MKIVQTILYSVCATILLGVAVIFAAPNVPAFGAFDIKIVKSGSMEPSIMTGAIVMMKEQQAYVVGDVITFVTSGADIPTTHRIMAVVEEGGRTGFITKGDANEEADTAIVRPENVIGKVFFSAPYVGYLLDFVRQPLGFALIIGIPALLIVIDEVEKIWRELRGMRRRPGVVAEVNENVSEAPSAPVLPPARLTLREARVVDMRRPVPQAAPPPLVAPLSFTPTLPVRERTLFSPRAIGTVVLPSLLFFFVIFAVSSLFVRSTLSYFNDVERSIGNTFGAIAVHFSVLPSQTVFTFFDTDTETPEATLESEVVQGSGSVPLQYALFVTFATGTPALCDAIVASTNDLPAPYSGPLLGLSASGVTLSQWGLALNLGPGAYAPGDVCEVDMVYGGWNASQPLPIAYEDTERVRLSFTAPASALRSFSILLADEVIEAVSEMPKDQFDASSTTPPSEEQGGQDVFVDDGAPIPSPEEIVILSEVAEEKEDDRLTAEGVTTDTGISVDMPTEEAAPEPDIDEPKEPIFATDEIPAP